MDTEDKLIEDIENMPVNTTGEPVDQLDPDKDDIDEENMESADGDEVPYEGLHEDDDDNDLVDDNMAGMPVIPSPS